MADLRPELGRTLRTPPPRPHDPADRVCVALPVEVPDEALIRGLEHYYVALPSRFEPLTDRDEDYVTQ